MHIINSPPSVNSKSPKSREQIPPISNLLDFKIHFLGFLSTYIYTSLFPNLVTWHNSACQYYPTLTTGCMNLRETHWYIRNQELTVWGRQELNSDLFTTKGTVNQHASGANVRLNNSQDVHSGI